ncbi:hypothetical protein Bca52824_040716 [Brassica carinata]|uniref:thioglucosidase n=1 Tax=Brassica carinata TaxID=52824 RepID=A0A8X7UX28_BRACI|nr:hypothetical protein Bca52824_040716 [Brassica carinata]
MEQILFLIFIFLSFAFSGRCSDVYSRNDFPKGFVFGSAVSAFQWEGAVDEDGRIPSIWDTYVHSSDGPTEDIACDGYHKYKEDVRLMYSMRLDAFLLSISWPRLIPSGRGPVNPKGLRFYKNFIDELIRYGIEPHVTLYHNDLPQALEDEYGGWIDQKIINDFTAFADVCFREFGSKVKSWWTINEPNMLAWGGYDLGCVIYFLFYISDSSAYNNMLLAHASTTRLYKQMYKDKQHGSVGITLFAYWMVPFTSSEEDKIATQRAKAFYLAWFVEHNSSIKKHGRYNYPDVMKRTVGERLPSSSDFLGLIHYTTLYTAHLSSSIHAGHFDSDMNASLLRMLFFHGMCFDVLPWGFEGVLKYIKQNYGNLPVYNLENGQPTNQHSSINDLGRVEYLHAYIAAVLNSVRSGSDIRGYFQWSFMDMFEFINPNYTYGLYYVNFSDPKRERSPKTSALWYSALLKGKTVSLQKLKNRSMSSSPGVSCQ